jgi:hypothetical protein
VAETCVFGKQSLEPAPCGPLRLGGVRSHSTGAGRPFSRSYGANLPSSLTEDRSSTLGDCPQPTSVGVRYGLPRFLAERLFWARPSSTSAPSSGARHPPPRLGGVRICLDARGHGPTGPVHSTGCHHARASPPRSPAQVQDYLPARHRLRWRLPNQPRLRTRLTLGRLPLPRNPQASGVGRSQPHRRYSFRHSRFGSLHPCSRAGFSASPERSPTAWGGPAPPHARLRSRA